ncbi:MAG TPA: hypothetical protein VM553_02765 [Dongiaceae bacterium]|nr:hypothetical protein [Dongiaceae bacterium]
MPAHYIHRLFDIMEEFGDDPDVCYALVNGADEPVRWHFLRHQDVDGMGLFLHAARVQGIKLEVPKYSGVVPGTLQRVRYAWRKFRTRTPQPVQWRTWSPTPDGRVEKHSAMRLGRVLTAEQTQIILANAKRQQVTLNSFLLWALNAAVAQQLTVATTPRAWGNTINLRGAVPAESAEENQSSIITVVFDDADSPAQVHSTVRRLFDEGHHWGSWDFLSTICRFGPNLVRKQIRRYYGSNNSQMGTFSNLGVWNWDTASAAPYMYFCPPCTRTAPVAAAAGTLNGSLCLTLALHPFLCPGSELLELLLQDWVDRLTRQ